MQMRYGLSSDKNRRVDIRLMFHRLPFGFAGGRFYFAFFFTSFSNDLMVFK